MKRLIILLPVILTVMLSSCRKDELTLPSKVYFDFELKSFQDEQAGLKSGPPSGGPFGRIEVDRGELVINSIEFDGRRDQGRDVFFTSNPGQTLIVDLETGHGNQQLSFDIPQGVYNRIELYLHIGDEGEVPLRLEGRIRRGQSSDLPVRFEYNIRERIRIRAEDGKQTGKVVIARDRPSRARIIVDAGELFMFARLPALQNAELTAVDGVEMLIISSDKNTGIFNSMATRLEKSFRVVFD